MPQRRPTHRSTAQPLATGLGWFSIALGFAEVLAPRALARGLGMEDRAGLIQAYGVREIATGIGILASRDPTPWIWGRIGGDGLDLATLAGGLGEDNPQRDAVGLAIGAVAMVTALDVVCARSLMQENGEHERAVRRPTLSPTVRRVARDYRSRSGLPRGVEASRGLAAGVSLEGTAEGRRDADPHQPATA